MRKRLKVLSASLLLLSLIIPLTVFLQTDSGYDPSNIECYMILAGKDASADGSVLVAHNLELSGTEISMIGKYPGKKHRPNDRILFETGLQIPEVDETYGWMVLRISRSLSSNAVAINEHQVALAGGVNLMRDRNLKAKEADPVARKGVTGLARNVALVRSRSARESIEILGELYNRYGNAYPCGVGYADTDEVWYIESGGGRTWAAVRIPDDSYFVQGNGYRIDVIDPGDKENVLVSPGLLEFAEENGLWDPGKGPFSFRKAFGGATRRSYGNARREWRGIDLLSPLTNPDATKYEFPMFSKPDKNLTVEMLFSVLRDHCAGTPYDSYPKNGKIYSRPVICSPRVIHTNVIQLRPGLPPNIGGILWAGLSTPITTAYLPLYYGVKKIPKEYSISARSGGAAHHIFKDISVELLKNYNDNAEMVIPKFMSLENEWLKSQASIEREAIKLYLKDPESSRRFLTDYVEKQSDRTIKLAGGILEDLRNKADRKK